MYNRIIAIVIVFFLFVNTAFAGSSLKEILLTNSTYAGTWSDPSSGMKYYTGGGIKVKFKNTGSGFTPWVKLGTPNYNVGCNGISISGGFVSLLGLDDIERQLQDAGAAFAWGILIGLAYSLPAISDVFQKIQKWARAIQNLLQNMCNIGQNLSKLGTGGKKITDVLQNSAIDKGFGDIKKQMESIDSVFEDIDKLANCATPECTKDKAEAVAKVFSDHFKSDTNAAAKVGVGVTGGVAKNVKNPSKDAPRLVTTSLSKILNTSNKYLNITDEQILHIKLALLYFGDIALSQESVQSFSNLFKADGTLNEDELKANMKEAVAEGKIFNEVKYELIPEQVSSEKVVSQMINGTKEPIYVKNYKLIIITIPNKKDKEKVATYVYLLKDIDKNETKSDNLKFEWGGFYNESVKQVINLLNTNIDGSNNGLFTLPTDTSTVSTEKEYVPVLVPSMRELVTKLKESTVSNPNLKVIAEKTGYMIAQVNAGLAAEALANEVYSRVKIASKSSSDLKNVEEFLSSITETKKELQKGISKTFKEDRKELSELYDEVRKVQNNARLKTVK